MLKNFYIRSLTSLFLASVFLVFVYLNNFYFNLLLILIFLLGVLEVSKLKNKIIITVILILFVMFLISFHNLRQNFNGFFLVIWCLFITWFTDTFAFIFGRFFGKKKIQFISPNKTYFGFISGLLMSQLTYPITNFFFINKSFYDYKIIFVIQFITSFFVIFGDLLFSYFKRKMDIKDYSNILPGHGGIFDRIDGLIFSIIYFNIIF